MKYLLFALLLLPFHLLAQNTKNDNYWQQEVNTQIEVTLNDETHFLHGFISMEYINHSPDTLHYIYFHLYPNAYQNDRTAFNRQAVENKSTKFYFSPESDRGYMDSLQFKTNNTLAKTTPTKDPDIIQLHLATPLLPQQKVSITTPFRVKIPAPFSRLGHDGQSYQISQWFPKPAVYDAKGWHPIPYLDQGEFYSEFGSYDVKITVPENYIVMATGNLLNPEENLWLDSLSKLPIPSDTLFTNSEPASSENWKTLHFKEENIHDFAWFADKKWIVRKEIITLPEGQEVTSYSCYFPVHQKGWALSLEDISTAIQGYSQLVGPYPFKTVKAVEGALSAGGGMEYPTVTVIASTNNRTMINTAIIHEVGHNWFYGILGSNERKHPWLDEGLNSFYENKLTTDAHFSIKGRDFDVEQLAYQYFAGVHELQPATLSSEDFKMMNYGIDVYKKVPLYLKWLESYMGEETFEKAMKDYYQQFQFKHPQPEDFERIFKSHANKDIQWFFDVMQQDKSIDFAIKSSKFTSEDAHIRLKNKSKIAAPVLLNLTRNEKNGDTVIQQLWVPPFLKDTVVNLPLQSLISWQKVQIADEVPDYRKNNNYSKKRFGIGFMAGLDIKHKNKIWLAPALGYNYYDGFMAGILAHNLTIPERKVQFAIAPLYGFKSKKIGGTGVIGHSIYLDHGAFKYIQVQLEGKTFDDYYSKLNTNQPVSTRFVKIAPEVVFHLRKANGRSPIDRSFGIKGYFIQEESMNYRAVDSNLYQPYISGNQKNLYAKLWYDFSKSTTFNPYSYHLEAQFGETFMKLSAEAQFRIDYFLKKKGLDVRFYAGKISYFQPANYGNRYQLSTTYSGINDYLYDETYLFRNQQGGNGWHNQVSMKEGGFKVNTLKYAQPLGYSNNWLFAMNLKTDIPYLPIPLKVFADIATYTDAKNTNPSGATVLYEAGLQLDLGKVASIYFPLILSKDLNDYSHSVLGKGRFGKMIGFSLNLSEINWLKIPSQLIKATSN